ncbi:hypothetical protein Patl1_16531 [Pistacia atlantica]|uniref:Uncharacterized protein n=1 Tax=Pistacia atlantica TaxID=434234 RepID=A0ACC1BAJ1_9ROSI|nr:hypothetical protein Patl1_16531 [Pistacia atlantica]
MNHNALSREQSAPIPEKADKSLWAASQAKICLEAIGYSALLRLYPELVQGAVL